ncbi:hypothetical protein LDENG_00201510 [Lucifuga dentata]|nr:hypothetical protein LDENG_00201510 [Lucifuga dentata]
MARNEEKQQGKLNRLWLQKEREEGRLKDVHERRPKLSALNSTASVKKWIPGIKREIEYYLQQSQLTHYPERKIAEFQLRIEALEKEYKSFITKLRVLDPSCKHKPWTPRAYCKRRTDAQDSSSTGQFMPVKKSLPCESQDDGEQLRGAESNLACKWTVNERQDDFHQSVARFQTRVPTSLILQTSEPVDADQDQPLSFDRTRLAVATAALRGPSGQSGSPQTQSLARVLQSRLPNLGNSPVGQTQGRETAWARENDAEEKLGYSAEQKGADCEATERRPGESSSTGHLLGLGCYSSSDEDTDPYHF